MKLIEPIVMEDAVLLSSNVAEPAVGEPAYDAGTTYDTGDRVSVVSSHLVYESAIDSNTGNDPSTDDGSNWILFGSTNRWRAFDAYLAYPTERSGSIEYVFEAPSQITGIAFLNLDAESVRVVIKDLTSATVYDETKTVVDNTEAIDWFSYFFSEVVYEDEALFLGTPGYTGYEITVTISASSGTASVGQIVLGREHAIGVTLNGAEIGLLDYSTKSTDEFGRTTFVNRDKARTTTFPVWFNTGDARRIRRILERVSTTVCVYYVNDNTAYLGTTVFGVHQGIRLPLTNANGKSYGTIEIQGQI